MGNSGSMPPDGGLDKTRLALMEFEGMNDMLKGMSNYCWNKCIKSFNDSDLSVAELSCVDKCVVKYISTFQLVGNQFREASMKQQTFGG